MDTFFGPAWVDVDEWRDAPLRHRYVHGGFKGTDTRFAFYFPEKARWRGRFLSHLQGGLGGSELGAARQGTVDLAFENGAYLVDSNQGHIGNDMSGVRGDATILNYRASSQACRYARELAREVYGDEPAYGYVSGGSGGGVRSIACIEAVPELYDGAVPSAMNHNAFFAHNWSVEALVEPVIRDRLAEVIDAVEPGGSGDPFAVLETAEQRDALATLYRSGYPRGGEWLIAQSPPVILAVQSLVAADPGYVADFWSQPAYAGPRAHAMRVQEKAVVRRVVKVGDLPGYGTPSDNLNLLVYSLFSTPADRPVGVVLDVDGDLRRFFGARLHVASGTGAGRTMLCSGAVGDALVASFDAADFTDVEPGDEVECDNSAYVAFAHFHRHRVHASYPTMRQWVIDGRPVHVQRGLPIPEGGGVYRGMFDGRMVLVQFAQDRECWPSTADAYARQVRSNMGLRTDEHFRLWWVDRAGHVPQTTRAGLTRFVLPGGVIARALQDVIAWVEDGVAPPASTAYELDESGRLALPEQASARLGVQPVAVARANGAVRADVKVGEAVRFEGTGEVPPGAGSVAWAQWDFDGEGTWPARSPDAAPGATTIRFEAAHAYDTPGTYFAAFRVCTHRDGAVAGPARIVEHLDRVRVVVT